MLFFTLKNRVIYHQINYMPQTTQTKSILKRWNMQAIAQCYDFLIFITHKTAREQWHIAYTKIVPFQFNGIHCFIADTG